MSRGSGWSTLAWDAKGKTPHVRWTADHELGMLADVKIILTVDMWERAYKNLNWKVVENRFTAAQV